MTDFKGTVSSDFLKKVAIPDTKKGDFIDYAATDFLTLRSALIDYIKAVYPLEYQNFSESDLGMMLLELVAYMGSVFSLKADLLANENYFLTARNRYNVQKLLQLIGISMKGPTSAAANADWTIPTALSENFITMRPENRAITITAPEDGAPLSYTLYKVIAGKVQDINSTGNIQLYASEATDPDSATVWDNLALLEGSLAIQTGTLPLLESVATVDLAKGPVIEGSVQVFVNAPEYVAGSGVYTQVENLYFASGATDKIFQVNLTQDFKGTVVFGDDITGQAPPPGANYIISYRVGGGTRGNIMDSIINSNILGHILNTDGSAITGVIQNTSLATGGADAETVAHAKKYAPLFFKSQDRLVTLQDYVAHSNSFMTSQSTMGKATAATRKGYASANMIDVYILEKASTIQLQKASSSFKMALLTYLNERKMLTDELTIVDGVIRSLDLVITIRVDRELEPREEEIKAATRDAILNFFAVDNMDYGQPFIMANLSRDVFKLIPEVRYATVDNLTSDVLVDFNEIIQLNNFVINVAFI